MLIILPATSFKISFSFSFKISLAFVFGDSPVSALSPHDPRFDAAVKTGLVNRALESRVKIRKMRTCQNLIRADFVFVLLGFLPGVRIVSGRR